MKLDAAQVLAAVKGCPACTAKLAPVIIEARLADSKNAGRAKRARAWPRLSCVRS